MANERYRWWSLQGAPAGVFYGLNGVGGPPLKGGLLRFVGYPIAGPDPNGYVYLQVHDKAAALVGGEFPLCEVPVPLFVTASLDFLPAPLFCPNGLILAWSSTGFFYTAGGLGFFCGASHQ